MSRHPVAERANDAFLAGDSDSAVAWCEEALRDCREPVLAADIKLILGRARTWMGDPHRSYDDLVQAAVTIQPLDAARAASLFAEATLPAAIAGHVRLAVEAAAQTERTWQNAGISPDSGLMSPKALAMVAEAFVISGSLDRASHYLGLAEKALSTAEPVREQQGIASLGQSLIGMECYSQARGHLNAVIDTARHKGAPGHPGPRACHPQRPWLVERPVGGGIRGRDRVTAVGRGNQADRRDGIQPGPTGSHRRSTRRPGSLHGARGNGRIAKSSCEG